LATHEETFNGLYQSPFELKKLLRAEKDLQDLLQQSFDGKEDVESTHQEIDMFSSRRRRLSRRNSPPVPSKWLPDLDDGAGERQEDGRHPCR